MKMELAEISKRLKVENFKSNLLWNKFVSCNSRPLKTYGPSQTKMPLKLRTDISNSAFYHIFGAANLLILDDDVHVSLLGGKTVRPKYSSKYFEIPQRQV